MSNINKKPLPKKKGKNAKTVNKKKAWVEKKKPLTPVPIRKESQIVQQRFTSNNSSEQNTVKISATFDATSYRDAFFSMVSYLAQKNAINVNTDQSPTQWRVIYDSILYLIREGASNFQGGVAAVNELPRNVNNLYKALLPKQLKYELGHISFGFKEFTTSSLNLSNTIYGHQFAPTYVDSDGGGSNEAANIYNPNPIADSYSQFLSIIGELAPRGMLQSVNFKDEAILSECVSTFARVYSYVGNQLSPYLGGTWLDVELEVGITAPMLAKFVPYQDDANAMDPRLPKYLRVSSLDSLATLGWPLHDSFPGYYHKPAPLVNQINADEVFVLLALWMAKLKQKAAENGVPGALDPLPMSEQEFYLVLRSALLNVYDSQYYMQFCGDSQWTGTNANAFLGFFVMAHCAGNTTFGRLQVPTILAENLHALSARSYMTTSVTSKQSFQPVIGRWYRDTLPVVNIVGPDGKIVGPLFSAVPGESPIDYIDCSYNGQFINVQGVYYQNVLQDWNDQVEKFRQYSVDCQPMSSDSGPKGLLIATTTRLQKVLELEPPTTGEVQRNTVPGKIAQGLNFIANKPFEAVLGGDGKKTLVRRASSVKLQPDATLLTVTTTDILSKFPLSEEILGLVDIIILPSDRPSKANDVFTKQQIQTIKKEPLSYARDVTQSVQAGTGAGEFNRLNEYANQLVTGFAREETTKFQVVFKHLISNGKAGFLAGVLGGIAKTIFPGSESTIDTIASMVPI